jgi:hypothetical protein
MPNYLISFDDDAMQFSDEELIEVGETAREVVREAKAAGVWIFGGGVDYGAQGSIVDGDGNVTDVPYPARKDRIGGMSVISAPNRQEALRWAARFAAGCRVPQFVREFMDDPESVNEPGEGSAREIHAS